MILIIYTFVMQLLFQMSRSLGTRYLSKDNIHMSAAFTFIIQVLWLVTTWIGVKAVDEMNWPIISAYMLGGVIGVYVNYWIVPNCK